MDWIVGLTKAATNARKGAPAEALAWASSDPAAFPSELLALYAHVDGGDFAGGVHLYGLDEVAAKSRDPLEGTAYPGLGAPRPPRPARADLRRDQGEHLSEPPRRAAGVVGQGRRGRLGVRRPQRGDRRDPALQVARAPALGARPAGRDRGVRREDLRPGDLARAGRARLAQGERRVRRREGGRGEGLARGLGREARARPRARGSSGSPRRWAASRSRRRRPRLPRRRPRRRPSRRSRPRRSALPPRRRQAKAKVAAKPARAAKKPAAAKKSPAKRAVPSTKASAKATRKAPAPSKRTAPAKRPAAKKAASSKKSARGSKRALAEVAPREARPAKPPRSGASSGKRGRPRRLPQGNTRSWKTARSA